MVHLHWVKANIYRPPTKLLEGNVFTSVCLSTGVGMGGYLWSQVLSRGGVSILGPRSLPGEWVPRGGYVQGVSTQGVGYVQGWVLRGQYSGSEYPGGGYSPSLLTPSSGHQNMYGCQAGAYGNAFLFSLIFVAAQCEHYIGFSTNLFGSDVTFAFTFPFAPVYTNS